MNDIVSALHMMETDIDNTALAKGDSRSRGAGYEGQLEWQDLLG
jgi:hypothetical protein